jgi:EAL domain-containing protein (putative c-di-GMP-specific phosphodiesterase class I)
MVHFAARREFILLAEAVETSVEQAALLGLGVSHAQGFLFGRPVSAAEVAQARS